MTSLMTDKIVKILNIRRKGEQEERSVLETNLSLVKLYKTHMKNSLAKQSQLGHPSKWLRFTRSKLCQHV